MKLPGQNFDFLSFEKKISQLKKKYQLSLFLNKKLPFQKFWDQGKNRNLQILKNNNRGDNAPLYADLILFG